MRVFGLILWNQIKFKRIWLMRNHTKGFAYEPAYLTGLNNLLWWLDSNVCGFIKRRGQRCRVDRRPIRKEKMCGFIVFGCLPRFSGLIPGNARILNFVWPPSKVSKWIPACSCWELTCNELVSRTDSRLIITTESVEKRRLHGPLSS